ncbi:hypothetical protein H5410_057995 [Solanum commersonii]|uniref:Reverse transcriptase zinc-binding domain-containing protein n=1 Tax=Solanum commersonii TaxID=4109 RepID=A0A9J5WRC6_SOLCO|nr:hypothetical protein H5410_057995 [Solanum commersonii]
MSHSSPRFAFVVLMANSKKKTTSLAKKRKTLDVETSSKTLVVNQDSILKPIKDTHLVNESKSKEVVVKKQNQDLILKSIEDTHLVNESKSEDSVLKKWKMISLDECIVEIKQKAVNFDPKKVVYWRDGQRVLFMFVVKASDAILKESAWLPSQCFVLKKLLATHIDTTDKRHNTKYGFRDRDIDCSLCNSASLEDDEQLFCQCPRSKDIWMKVRQLLGISLPHKGVKDMLQLIKHRHWNRGRKVVVVALYEAVIYYTWLTRNHAISLKNKMNCGFIIEQIKHIIRERVLIIQNARFWSNDSVLKPIKDTHLVDESKSEEVMVKKRNQDSILKPIEDTHLVNESKSEECIVKKWKMISPDESIVEIKKKAANFDPKRVVY